MKQKRHRYRNRILAIKGRPQFGQKIEKSGKGKGSYARVNVNRSNFDDYSESAVA